jgi:hypothetical protein
MIGITGLNLLLIITTYITGKQKLIKYLEDYINNDCITIGFDENVFPHFDMLQFNNNVKYYQHQFDKVILQELKNNLQNNDLCKIYLT